MDSKLTTNLPKKKTTKVTTLTNVDVQAINVNTHNKTSTPFILRVLFHLALSFPPKFVFPLTSSSEIFKNNFSSFLFSIMLFSLSLQYLSFLSGVFLCNISLFRWIFFPSSSLLHLSFSNYSILLTNGWFSWNCRTFKCKFGLDLKFIWIISKGFVYEPRKSEYAWFPQHKFEREIRPKKIYPKEREVKTEKCISFSIKAQYPYILSQFFFFNFSTGLDLCWNPICIMNFLG